MYKTIGIIILAIGLVTGRQINSAGLNLIREFEGFSSYFYKDPRGIKTIGYGHVCNVNYCSEIIEPISRAKGELFLKYDLANHESCIQSEVPFVNNNQFAALVSISFDLGLCLKGSNLMKYVKAMNYGAAANEFGRLGSAYDNPQVALARRVAERKLFLQFP